MMDFADYSGMPSPEIVCREGMDKWFVLRTKSRQEKVIANDLRARGAHFFLPLVIRPRYFGGHKLNVELPLFPGYLFLWGVVDDAYAVDRTKRIAQIIPVYDQKRLDSELRQIHRALCAGHTLDPYPYLRQGITVEVREGPLHGVRGIVESRAQLARIILRVDILGQAVSLETDGALVDIVDEPATRSARAAGPEQYLAAL
jgi:transcription antitermination factor NusG